MFFQLRFLHTDKRAPEKDLYTMKRITEYAIADIYDYVQKVRKKELLTTFSDESTNSVRRIFLASTC